MFSNALFFFFNKNEMNMARRNNLYMKLIQENVIDLVLLIY